MDSMGFMVAFDVVVAVLGVYLVVRTIMMKNKKEIPSIFVAAEEIKNCKDVPAFCDYIFPKALIFGIVCVIFGVIDFVIDYGIYTNTPKYVNVVLLVLFLAVWFWFSWGLKKGKEKFFKTMIL